MRNLILISAVAALAALWVPTVQAIPIDVNPTDFDSVTSTGLDGTDGAIGRTLILSTNAFATFDVTNAIAGGAITSASLEWTYSANVSGTVDVATFDTVLFPIQLTSFTNGTFRSGAGVTNGAGSTAVTVHGSSPVAGSGTQSLDVLGIISGSFGAQWKVTTNNTNGVLTGVKLVLDGTGGAFAPPNTDPVAVAGGPYVFNSGNVNSLQLDGSASSDPDTMPDPGSMITDYDWNTDNVGSFNDATGATPSISLSQTTLTQPGDTGTVGLRVTDDLGATGTDTSPISYTNVGPSANAGADLLFSASDALGPAKTAMGTVSDPDLAANGQKPGFEKLSYTWSNGGGLQMTADGQTGPLATNSSVSFAQAAAALGNTTGSYMINLSVTDNNALTAGGPAGASDSLMVTYSNDATQVSSPSATEAMGGTDVSATISDADLNVPGAPNNFEVVNWEFNDGMGNVFASGVLNNQTNNATEQVTAFIPDTFMGNNVFLDVFDLARGSGNPLTTTINLGGAVVPEPATLAIWTLLGIGLGCYVVRRRIKR